MRCATHPEVETSLRCGKCGKPICPKCLVQTPVGARCADCARLEKLPTYHVSFRYYLRAIGAGLSLAIVSGIAWGALGNYLPLNLSLLIAPGMGYAIGEVISLSTNRKRGAGLIAVGSIALVAGYIVSLWFASFLAGIPFLLVFRFSISRIGIDLLALALGIYVTVTRLR